MHGFSSDDEGVDAIIDNRIILLSMMQLRQMVASNERPPPVRVRAVSWPKPST